QSRNKRYVRYHTHYLLILSAAILMVVEYVFSFLPLEWHAVAIVSLSIYLAMNLSSILLVLLSRLLEKVKHHSLFKLFHLKYLRTNRHIHQSLRVLLISLISLVLIFSVRAFLFSEIESFQNSMTFDLALTNVYDYDIDVLDEIASYGADQSDSATYYQNVTIYFNEDEFQPCTFFVSMEYDSFDIYFDFNGAEVDPQYIDDDLPYVLLPLDFQIVYDLVPGDTVIMDLNYKMEGVEMVVAGFLQTNFDNIIYSDIMLRPQYEDLAKPNTIFFITDKKQALNQDLIQDYSSKMYYVLDPDLYFGEYIHSAENVIDFFTVFSFFMIVCFIIIIFNNTLLVFYGLKSDIAKIKVLGGGATVFLRNLFKEYLLMVVIILMVGLPEIMILSVKLKYVVLLTDYYKNITSTPLTITYGYAIVGIVLILSYLFYFYNIQKAKIVDEIKNI
ncbi:MAG: hypothetical protein JXL85_03210, partial [Bacilli bacterium]|nr:hypothetical protein [Bacilli bacterium]